MNAWPAIQWEELPRLRGRAVALLVSGPVHTSALATELFQSRAMPEPVADRLVREVLGDDPRFQDREGHWLLRDFTRSYGSGRLSEIDFVIVDIEATGGSPTTGDRITEVAAVRVRDGAVIGSFESLVNPEKPIPRAVTALTNITNDMVAKAPRFSELADRLRSTLEGAVFVAHNASYDWRFLQAELARCRGVQLLGQPICTLRLARRLHPELPRRSLRTLTDYYSIGLERWHRAGPDARATAQLFVRFLDRLAEQGVRRWDQLQGFLSTAGDAPEDDPEDLSDR